MRRFASRRVLARLLLRLRLRGFGVLLRLGLGLGIRQLRAQIAQAALIQRSLFAQRSSAPVEQKRVSSQACKQSKRNMTHVSQAGGSVGMAASQSASTAAAVIAGRGGAHAACGCACAAARSIAARCSCSAAADRCAPPAPPARAEPAMNASSSSAAAHSASSHAGASASEATPPAAFASPKAPSSSKSRRDATLRGVPGGGVSSAAGRGVSVRSSDWLRRKALPPSPRLASAPGVAAAGEGERAAAASSSAAASATAATWRFMAATQSRAISVVSDIVVLSMVPRRKVDLEKGTSTPTRTFTRPGPTARRSQRISTRK